MKVVPSFGGSGRRVLTALVRKFFCMFVAVGLALGAGGAVAGVAIGVTPNFPTSVKVGQTGLPADLIITWANTIGNETHGNRVTGLSITPSCGAIPSQTSACPPASVEAGIPTPISLSSTAIGSADCRDPANPAVVPNPPRTFVISPPGTPGGAWTITPDFFLPAPATPADPAPSCIITFQINVNALPTKDASASQSGLQTGALAGGGATDAVDNRSTGSGSGSTTVSFPQLTTTPIPANGNLGSTPVPLSDTAQISGLVPNKNTNPPSNPSGTVTFQLYPPGDPNCAGAAVGGPQTVNLSDPARCTITPGSFLTNCTMASPINVSQAGVWRWTAAYSGDVNNIPISSVCTDEPVPIGPAQPVLATTPNPSPGKVGTALNDSGQLSIGQAPYGGSITFSLFDPSQATCNGVPRYTQTVPVNAAGFAVTSPGFIADMSGTWRWTADYSGDGNNRGANSGCTAEQVDVVRPVLTIVKTPDGQTYAAGQPITFNILVTNQGPGTALNVRYSPADQLPDPNRSLSWSISNQPAGNPCSIVGAVGAQLLNCSFGNMVEGASTSVTVQTATQAADPGDCGNPQLVLNNSATVVADNADAKTDTGSLICRPGTPPLSTVPNPATGKVGGPAINDSAQLGGVGPFTGTITFSLFDPLQNCSGTPRFTQTVPVSATGSASTTGGFVPDKSGIWQWTATYSGDANNNPAFSGCGSEPVTIARPILAIAKTPDGTTYALGATIKWTVVVTNQGPGTAQSVTFAPADVLPDPNKSLNWSIATQPVGGNCTIGGAIGTQALNCTFGDLLEGASSTVVVSSPTEVNDPGDCPVGVVLTNTATVTATNADPKSDTGTQSCLGNPVLRLQKTPDGGIYAGGDPITFSLAITNDGPGVARKVRLEPADLLPDPNGSLNWSISQQPAQGSCTITGAIGAQSLNCAFGDMNAASTLTVTVKTDTQAGDPGDCGPNGTVLSNSATVKGDNTNTATDTGSQSCKASRPIPTLSPLGMGLLMLLLAGAAIAVMRRRRP